MNLIEGFEGRLNLKKIIIIIAICVILASMLIFFQKITCNKLEVKTVRQNGEIYFKIDSDLPDFTDLKITVTRPITIRGVEEKQFLDYEIINDTLINFINLTKLQIDNEQWEKDIKLLHQNMPYSLDLADISDYLHIVVEVPQNQSNKKFGEGNCNLKGSLVAEDGTISNHARIHSPLENESKIVPKESFKIAINKIPELINYYSYTVEGRVNPKYKLYINEEYVYMSPGTDKFGYLVELSSGDNLINVKLITVDNRKIFEENYPIKVVILRS